MTITTPIHHDVCKDGQVDRRVDVQIDGRKAVGKDSGGLPGGRVRDRARQPQGRSHEDDLDREPRRDARRGRPAGADRRLRPAGEPQRGVRLGARSIPGERLEDLLANPDAADRYTPPLALQPDVVPELPWRERLRIIPSTDALADVAADLPVTGGPGYELRLRQVLEPLRDSSTWSCSTPRRGWARCRGWRSWRLTGC